MSLRTVLLFVSLTALFFATPPLPTQATPIVAEGIPLDFDSADFPLMVEGVWSEEPSQLIPQTIEAVMAPPAHDSCGGAQAISVPIGGEASAGVSTATGINEFSNEATDPSLLGCIDGTPERVTGYRTAWYRFTAGATGYLHIVVDPNFDHTKDYDTVLAVWESTGDSCGQWQLQVCNDDYNGRLSQVDTWVEQGKSYYIEVADRNLAVNGLATLFLRAWIETNSFWSRGGIDLYNSFLHRSRHAVVAVNDSLYLIGGQSADVAPGFSNTAPTRTNSNARFDTTTQKWHPIPSSNCDLYGYSNMDAVHLNGKIYIPSGYVGDNTLFQGRHCVYDIATNAWEAPLPSAPWVNEPTIFYGLATRPSINTYYLTGGLNGPMFSTTPTSSARAEIYAYRADTNLWFQVGEMNGGRYAHTVQILKNSFGTDRYLCVAGGLRPNATQTLLLQDGECLDLSSGTWFSIGGTQTPRFMAGSVIGPDGRWYIYGGVGPNLEPVATWEVFDPTTSTWRVLDNRYNLDTPVRGWVRGGFVGQNFYALGGESKIGGDWRITGVIDVMALPQGLPPLKTYLPVMMKGYEPLRTTRGEPNNTFRSAEPISLGQTLSADFNDPADRFDLYRFELNDFQNLRITLNNIPTNENYDLYLFDSNKQILSIQLGFVNNPEQIDARLAPGVYHIMVVTAFNHPLITGTYQLALKPN